MLMDFLETSITGILLIRQSNEGQQPYANFKTAHFVKISQLHVDGFSQDFYNRGFDETIKMKGNNTMLTSIVNILLNILTPC